MKKHPIAWTALGVIAWLLLKNNSAAAAPMGPSADSGAASSSAPRRIPLPPVQRPPAPIPTPVDVAAPPEPNESATWD